MRLVSYIRLRIIFTALVHPHLDAIVTQRLQLFAQVVQGHTTPLKLVPIADTLLSQKFRAAHPISRLLMQATEYHSATLARCPPTLTTLVRLNQAILAQASVQLSQFSISPIATHRFQQRLARTLSKMIY